MASLPAASPTPAIPRAQLTERSPAAACPEERVPDPVTVDRSRVAVVLPTYNRPERLKRCLDGLRACETDGVSVEAFVIDDGSPAPAGEAIRALCEGGGGSLRVHYHRQPNGGSGAARNLGVRLADTDLVLFLDDDTVPDPGWIREMLALPWEDGVGLVGGRIVSPDQSSPVARFCRFARFNEYPWDDRPQESVNTANAAFLRRAVEEAGYFEPLLCGGGVDVDLSLRIVELGYRLDYAPGALMYHYHREDLRSLLKTFWNRGYRGTFRRALWDLKPTRLRRRMVVEALRLPFWVVQGLLLPLNALLLMRRGVAPGDTLTFACLAWLEKGLKRAGTVAMAWQILTGRRPLSRTSPTPAPPAGERAL